MAEEHVRKNFNFRNGRMSYARRIAEIGDPEEEGSMFCHGCSTNRWTNRIALSVLIENKPFQKTSELCRIPEKKLNHTSQPKLQFPPS